MEVEEARNILAKNRIQQLDKYKKDLFDRVEKDLSHYECCVGCYEPPLNYCGCGKNHILDLILDSN